MQNPKSRTEEYLLGLIVNIFADLAQKFPELKRSLSRDLLTVRQRVSHEGVSFITKTMPKLDKAIVVSLETGKLTRPKEFKPHGTKEIPAFLSGILSCLYSSDGTFKVECDRILLRDVRTLLRVAYKTEVPYTMVQQRKVLESFVENERIINELVLDINESVLQSARQIVERIFRGFDPKNVKPRHGPGSVATGERGNEKWRFKRLYSNIHSFYPYYDYFMVGGTKCLLDRVGWYKSLQRDIQGTAKVVLVPKDSRGPRLISCEPLEYQYIQQGLGRAIVRHLESHWMTKGHVNFTDQSINANLALDSSITREFATLDMKDASDMVSLQLVEALFSGKLLEALKATRTAATKLPTGVIVELKKFAPMGSALCFPVEAVVFFALCVAKLEHLGVRNAHSRAYVYGDDILVPTEHAREVMACLEHYGLTVNRDKSFVDGYFRESCGVDAYKGTIITPLRNKIPYISDVQDANVAASLVALGNNFRKRGFESTATFLFSQYRATFGKLPFGTARSSYLCEEGPSAFMAIARNIEAGLKVRWNPDTQTVSLKS